MKYYSIRRDGKYSNGQWSEVDLDRLLEPLQSLAPLVDAWAPIRGGLYPNLPVADFTDFVAVYKCFSVYDRVLALENAREQFANCAELLEFELAGEKAWGVHFLETFGALNLEKSKCRYYGESALTTTPVIKRGWTTQRWFFKVPEIGLTFTWDGPGSFMEFYPRNNLTGLVFNEVPVA